jgi:hypothetical protein
MQQLIQANLPTLTTEATMSSVVDSSENEVYIMRLAAMCWAIWVTRNKVTSDAYALRTTLEIVFTMCSFLMYWSGLQNAGRKDQVMEGTKKLMKLAADVARRSKTDGEQVVVRLGD